MTSILHSIALSWSSQAVDMKRNLNSQIASALPPSAMKTRPRHPFHRGGGDNLRHRHLLFSFPSCHSISGVCRWRSTICDSDTGEVCLFSLSPLLTHLLPRTHTHSLSVPVCLSFCLFLRRDLRVLLCTTPASQYDSDNCTSYTQYNKDKGSSGGTTKETMKTPGATMQ